MRCLASSLGHVSSRRQLCVGAVTALLAFSAQFVYADEAGVSFWLPGQVGSLAAVPATPGWSLSTVYYLTSVAASGSVPASREIEISRLPASANVSLNDNLSAHGDQLFLTLPHTPLPPQCLAGNWRLASRDYSVVPTPALAGLLRPRSVRLGLPD
jgi:hypothetical protein